jgi:hypothetical protein
MTSSIYQLEVTGKGLSNEFRLCAYMTQHSTNSQLNLTVEKAESRIRNFRFWQEMPQLAKGAI